MVKVPHFHFESRTWSYSEFFDEIRKTCVASLFKQSPSILGQIITTARKNKTVPKFMSQKVGLKLKKRSFFDRTNHASISNVLSPGPVDSSSHSSSKSSHSIFDYTSGPSSAMSASSDRTFVPTVRSADLDISTENTVTPRATFSSSVQERSDFGDLASKESSRVAEQSHSPRFRRPGLSRILESAKSVSSDK